MRRFALVLSNLLTALAVLAFASIATGAAPTLVTIIQAGAALSASNPLPISLAGSTNGVVITPTSSATYGIASVVSAAAETNHVFKASPGNLYGFSAAIGATSGYVMLFDATTLPANGAVTPKKCYPVTSNGTNGLVAASWNSGPPEVFATGITIGFSTTGCFTLTASTALYFSGDVQ